MYQLKKIINHDDEVDLPKCMYRVRNPNEFLKADDVKINISEQVIKFLKVYYVTVSFSLMLLSLTLF